MRLLISTALVLFLGAMVAFAIFNADERVLLNLNGTHDLPLAGVVFAAVLLGVLITGSAALVEGASIRMANRRLRKEIHQLETELNYLRTQPSASAIRSESEDDEITEPEQPQLPPASTPSAPDYAAEGAWDDDESDDVYSGQRGV